MIRRVWRPRLVWSPLAFALQKVISAIAGYFVILRGKSFGVGKGL